MKTNEKRMKWMNIEALPRSLGVPSFSSAQVAAAVRGPRGRVTPLEVVAAIHGPLTGARPCVPSSSELVFCLF